MSSQATVGRTIARFISTASRVAVAACLAFVSTLTAAVEPVNTDADAAGPAQTAYAPDSGRGPVVLLISGQSGRTAYQRYASEVAKLGYYVVLVDGKDILNREQWPSASNLHKALDRALAAPQALPGKAAVIGFSQGGGGALLHAAPLAGQVSMVVAYYPFTREWADKSDWLVKRFKAPVLVLAAQRDRYQDCCLVETAQKLEGAAKANGAKLELVVYPEADHGFNLQTGERGEALRAYRPDDDRDAWKRTTEWLKQYQPLS